MTFEDALAVVLHWEGGFTDNPNDPGGATNLGITHRTLADWLGRPVTVDEVRALTVSDVAPIYRRNYWDACRCAEMPAGVDLVLFDSAVNQGPGRAKRLLQRSVGAVGDGILGPATMAAVAKTAPAAVIDELVARRAVHYAGLQSDFHLGWYRRLASIHRHAIGA